MTSRTFMWGLLAGGALCVAFILPAAAQVQSSQTVTKGATTKEVKVERGEVVYVSGNDVIIKGEDGRLHYFANVPDSKTITVDGKQLNVHQLQVGMKVEKQTVTTTSERLVTKVETITGKVFRVVPPLSVTLTLEDGTNQTFKIPKGQKFNINGKETDAFGLKKGMVISAQRITETPETVVTEKSQVTGTMPPPPKADVPVLILVVPVPAPVEQAKTEPAPAKLPKTASELPLVGLLGALFCGISLTLTAVRKFAA